MLPNRKSSNLKLTCKALGSLARTNQLSAHPDPTAQSLQSPDYPLNVAFPFSLIYSEPPPKIQLAESHF